MSDVGLLKSRTSSPRVWVRFKVLSKFRQSEHYETVFLTPCLLSLVVGDKTMPLPEEVHRRLVARAVTDLDVACLLATLTKFDDAVSERPLDPAIPIHGVGARSLP